MRADYDQICAPLFRHIKDHTLGRTGQGLPIQRDRLVQARLEFLDCTFDNMLRLLAQRLIHLLEIGDWQCPSLGSRGRVVLNVVNTLIDEPSGHGRLLTSSTAASLHGEPSTASSIFMVLLLIRFRSVHDLYHPVFQGFSCGLVGNVAGYFAASRKFSQPRGRPASSFNVSRFRERCSAEAYDATKPPAIEFRNVYLSFDDHTVLSDISFKLAQGEMIFLTGISGSGKSVLLRLAMGLLKPDSGQILSKDESREPR